MTPATAPLAPIKGTLPGEAVSSPPASAIAAGIPPSRPWVTAAWVSPAKTPHAK